MQAIADEFDKTKAVLHYHYDTKEKLFVAFLDYLLTRFDQTVDVDRYDDPDEQLLVLLDNLLGEADQREHDEFDHHGITTALLQIRAQAPYNEDFQRQLTINAATIQSLLSSIIQDGIEQGVFRDANPDRTALTLLACVSGARIYGITIDQEGVETDVRETLHTFVREWLSEPETR